jgi:hypothetical protein
VPVLRQSSGGRSCWKYESLKLKKELPVILFVIFFSEEHSQYSRLAYEPHLSEEGLSLVIGNVLGHRLEKFSRISLDAIEVDLLRCLLRELCLKLQCRSFTQNVANGNAHPGLNHKHCSECS